jgi:hypothetical protein
MSSLTPKIWGPSTWIVLHLLSLSYPEKPTVTDIENHRNFLLSLSNVLPCKECRVHFKEHLQKCTLSNALKSRDDYVKCVWNMHNEVDSSKQISFEEFIKIYKEILDSDGYNPIKIHQSLKIYKYSTFGLILILLVLLFKFYKK